MFQPLVEPITFEEFLEWKPANGRYELHKGVITVSVYVLIEGEYQVTQFRGNDRIQSLSFPELNLTAEQVFYAALGEY